MLKRPAHEEAERNSITIMRGKGGNLGINALVATVRYLRSSSETISAINMTKYYV
jgi:hypothetical protein